MLHPRLLVEAVVGALFGASLRWTRRLSEAQIKLVGALTAGRTLLFGGLLFGLFGGVTLAGLTSSLPVSADYAVIGSFMLVVAAPAFAVSLLQVLGPRGDRTESEDPGRN